MSKQAVIFDLDGVIVTTDEFHYKAWKAIADEENLHFNREINEKLRGVSRVESLQIILNYSQKQYSEKEQEVLTERKNDIYRNLLKDISEKDILPGVLSFINHLKERGIKIAIGSSSKNTKFILEQIGLEHVFDAVADGNDITKSKPDPEVFLLAAERLQVEPVDCVVIEDAEAGIDAAISADMKAVGVSSAASYSKTQLAYANLVHVDINEVLD
ncbi:beta-phosphoglucomutase [Litchfieldia alkalitelluris]|uniref:beta-phosphoglucomutase n=1 Tax=Litchfieldia alkalitelluris TaxID=304268 RepID=UPI0009988541|nr:beta-phosphoglucomutase [Litchfieldia alkalitelluris]